MAKSELWLQSARRRMEKKGTVGKFGKATPAKIKRAKAEGGVKEKEAVFVENMKKIAAHHHALARIHEKMAGAKKK